MYRGVVASFLLIFIEFFIEIKRAAICGKSLSLIIVLLVIISILSDLAFEDIVLVGIS